MKAIQKKITRNIKRFDLCALLKLLYELGHKEEDIYFQSNPDTSSPSSLCEEIFFIEGSTRVTIVLNIGLLSGTSPLPNFFRKKMDAGSIDPILFSRFLSFFDHHLIKNLVAMSMPDVNDLFFSDWNKTQKDYLKLLDLDSTSTLWHLFQLCFPELSVQVEKAPILFKEKSSSATLGQVKLGKDLFLGKKIEQTIPSFKVTLTCEEVLTDEDIPWPLEVKTRLKTVLYPILQDTGIHFRVRLLIKNNRAVANLSPYSHLGYCRIGENKQALRLLLFSGYPKKLLELRSYNEKL